MDRSADLFRIQVHKSQNIYFERAVIGFYILSPLCGFLIELPKKKKTISPKKKRKEKNTHTWF